MKHQIFMQVCGEIMHCSTWWSLGDLFLYRVNVITSCLHSELFLTFRKFENPSILSSIFQRYDVFFCKLHLCVYPTYLIVTYPNTLHWWNPIITVMTTFKTRLSISGSTTSDCVRCMRKTQRAVRFYVVSVSFLRNYSNRNNILSKRVWWGRRAERQ